MVTILLSNSKRWEDRSAQAQRDGIHQRPPERNPGVHFWLDSALPGSGAMRCRLQTVGLPGHERSNEEAGNTSEGPTGFQSLLEAGRIA